jgi:CRISPR-associated protein Cas5d
MPFTAAVGVLESIFWKPEIKYKINHITVLKPISTFTIQRNMVESKQSYKKAKDWIKNNGIGGYTAVSDRAQRNHVILRDVAYIIDFNFDLQTEEDLSNKYAAQIKRKIEKGQCFKQPYFGCREYIAYFSFPTEDDQPAPELKGEVDLGLMPKQLHFIPDKKGAVSWRTPAGFVKGNVVTEFAHFIMIDGLVSYL